MNRRDFARTILTASAALQALKARIGGAPIAELGPKTIPPIAENNALVVDANKFVQRYWYNPRTYIYNVKLEANEFCRDQSVLIRGDVDFLWRSVVVTSNAGAFVLRFADSGGGYLSHSMIDCGSLYSHFPIFPEVEFPKGGRIGIDIQDVSGEANAIQICFSGVDRHPLSSEDKQNAPSHRIADADELAAKWWR